MFDVPAIIISVLLIGVLLALGEIVRTWIAEELFNSPRLRRPLVFELPVLIAAVLLLLVVPVLTLICFGISFEKHDLTVRDVEAMGVASAVTIGLLIPIMTVSRRNRLIDYGMDLRGWRAEARYGTLGFFASVPFVIAAIVLMLPFRHGAQHPYLKALEGTVSDRMVIELTFVTVVMAPLVEELVFRVVLQGMLAAIFRPAFAIVATALAFVCVHPMLDWIPLFPLALALGIVFHCRRSYVAVVVLHALFNATNLCICLMDSYLSQAGETAIRW